MNEDTMKMGIARKAAAILEGAEWGSNEHEVATFALWSALTGVQRDQLRQLLFTGPVWDGDVLSKSARGDLFPLGLAVRCCVKGEQGYTAASYRAYTIWNAGNPKPTAFGVAAAT